ncbi:META domain containing protein [Trypanosoma conorhini]|uniref:META domain containing protein n=1 Tax=Trypanosoma conorhini TaxID=83891 RepID=A0A3R7RUD8_9TRYP|nr:META domain containing protein [Trypanosoma conorhini]RNF13175.1 META domain containing protein [Trypanosoma conorhini]
MEEPQFFGTYVLERLDDEPLTTKATLELREVPDGVGVVAKVANTLRGQVKFSEGKVCGGLSSTMLTGSDEQSKIEGALLKGFAAGLEVHWDDGTLTLAGSLNTLVFHRVLTVESLVGRYTLREFNGEPVAAENMELVVVPSGEECVSVVAQFTKTFRGELRLDDDTLQGVLASTEEASEGAQQEMEERFDAGMGGGMRVSVEGKTLALKDDHCAFLYLRSLLPSDLAGEYVLKSLNGAPVRSDGQVTLALSQDGGGGVDVVAKVAGVLSGKVQLAEDTLRGELVATATTGSDAEMLVESALTSGFSAGFLCTVEEGRLAMRCGENTLVYTKAAAMPYANGKPTYLGESVVPCFKGHGNGLMFRITNADERKWAFYNDTTTYNVRVVVTFGSRSKVRGLGDTLLTLNEDGRQVAEAVVPPGATIMFITGHVNGYRCSYDAEPV